MTAEAAKIELAKFLERNGCLRVPNAERREEEGSRAYKKGYEVRFVAIDWEELNHIRDLMAACDIKAGQPYEKNGRIVQPVYGREAVEMFLGRPVKPVKHRPRTRTVKRLIHEHERQLFERLPAEERKAVLLREFYNRFLADREGQAGER